jgi:hypothetical protein
MQPEGLVIVVQTVPRRAIGRAARVGLRKLQRRVVDAAQLLRPG